MVKILAILLRHWKPLLALNLVLMGAIATAYSKTEKTFMANAQLILPDTGGRLDANLGTLGSLQNADGLFTSTQINPLKIQSSILLSDLLLKQVYAKDPERAEFNKFEDYKKLFKATPEESTTVIGLTVDGSSPDVARQRAIVWLETYQQRLDELRQSNSASREQYNQGALEQAGQNLLQTQQELAQFKASAGLINADEQTRGIVESMTTLTTARAQAVSQAQASQSRLRDLSSRLRLDPEEGVRSLSLAENQDFQFVRKDLVEAESALLKARAKYTDDSPLVQKLLEQRNKLRQQADGYISQASQGVQTDTSVATDTEGRATLIQQMVLAETDANAQRQQALQLEQQINQLSGRLRNFPVNQAKIAELQRQMDVAEGVYKGLVAQVQKSRIDAFNSYPNVQVLDLPNADAKPSSPKLSVLMINLLMASVVGSAALLLLLESRNPLLSPKDLQMMRFPLVARIPKLKAAGMRFAANSEVEPEFQRLASSISLYPLENRRLLVTSSIVGEGKTTVTLKLAIALADLGFRVLLVDGDSKRASLSQRLGQHPAEAADQPVFVGPRLDFLPIRSTSSQWLDLSSRDRLDQTLRSAEASAKYDYVLVDSPPMSASNQTSMLTAVAPNVLFVIRPGMSDRNSVRDSLEQLAQHNAKNLALVVNEEAARSQPYAARPEKPAPKATELSREWGETRV
jgi:polysaccharide biosynthesis transport protein